jgi:hypothetical protein
MSNNNNNNGVEGLVSLKTNSLEFFFWGLGGGGGGGGVGGRGANFDHLTTKIKI